MKVFSRQDARTESTRKHEKRANCDFRSFGKDTAVGVGTAFDSVDVRMESKGDGGQ